jgi:hypothetical protein
MKTRYVTECEFTEACKRAGLSDDQARMQLKWSLGLGSEVVVGKEILVVVAKDDYGQGRICNENDR